MKFVPALCAFTTFFSASLATSLAGLITSVPGPDDQGGMLMPMVHIQATAGTGMAPTAGVIHAMMDEEGTPVLQTLSQWRPGDWFAEGAAWREDLSPSAGSVPGMPLANAGNGDRFNNQYGFMFMGNGSQMMAYTPEGASLGIRLDSVSSPLLKAFNYGTLDNRWDQVFSSIGAQVLWNGTMWHNYFTLPGDAPAGVYTAVFEIFMADTPFTGGTGFAQYDAAALNAGRLESFQSAFVTYTFEVAPAAIPEPSTFGLLGVVLGGAIWMRGRRAWRGRSEA